MSPAKSAPRLARDGLRDVERAAVDRLEVALAADDAQLLAMRVVGERLDDVRARVDEVAMELRHDLRMLEHDLGHERAGLQVAAPLELEDVAFGADDGALVEALRAGRVGARRSGHGDGSIGGGRRARTIACFGGRAAERARTRRACMDQPGRIWNTCRASRRRRAMETLAFILHNLPAIGERTLEHLSIVSVAVGIAIVTGVPLGIAITQSQRVADTVLYLGSIVMTIPSIALFGVLIPILSKIGQGIGWLPAVIAAMLYAQLPIIRNTYTAIRNVDPALRSAAIGMGMSVPQRLRASRSRSRCR